eukprot:COSAG06_NODE_9052_length_2002_cov_2.008408_1_plen_118_part_01
MIGAAYRLARMDFHWSSIEKTEVLRMMSASQQQQHLVLIFIQELNTLQQELHVLLHVLTARAKSISRLLRDTLCRVRFRGSGLRALKSGACILKRSVLTAGCRTHHCRWIVFIRLSIL